VADEAEEVGLERSERAETAYNLLDASSGRR